MIPMPDKCSLIIRFTLLTLILAVAPAPGTHAQRRSSRSSGSNTAAPSATQVKTSLHLRWPGQQGVLRYRLQLARDEQFKDIVFDRAVFGREYVVTELAAGKYFWRVAPAVKETGTYSVPRPVEIASDAGSDAGVDTGPATSGQENLLVPTSNSGWRTTTGSIARPMAAHLRSATAFDLVGVNTDGMVYGLDGSNGVALWAARFRPNAKRGEQTGNGGAPVFT